LDPDAIESAITPRTKAILINSPNNPTGVVYDRNALRAVIEAASKRGIWVLSDEIYSEMMYDGLQFMSAGTFGYERTIVFDGASKSLSVPGWRLGWAVGPKELIDKLGEVNLSGNVCAATNNQHALLQYLQLNQKAGEHSPHQRYMSRNMRTFQERKDFLCRNLKPEFELVEPKGAFYLWLRAPGNLTGTEFANRCIKFGVGVVEGGAFSMRDTHVRVSYAAPKDALEEAIKRFKLAL
jgi:aspartate aminotransferase/aminotransferase